MNPYQINNSPKNVQTNIWDDVRSNVSLNVNVWHKVRGYVEDNVRDNIWDDVRANVALNVHLNIANKVLSAWTEQMQQFTHVRNEI
jgi:flagellar hook-basal body complex protein FliE